MASLIVNRLVLVILCIPLVQVHSKWNSTKIQDNHMKLANVTVVLAQRYFSEISTTVVIVERSVLPHMSDVNTQVLEFILFNLRETVAVQLYFGQAETQTWEYHIFVVDSAKAFGEIRWNFPKNCYERKFRFLIVLTKYTSRYFKALRRIFTLSYRSNVLNVSVILNHPTHGICMYTYNLFSENSCRVVQPVLQWQLEDGFDNLTHFFPMKLANFHGCPLRVSARQNPPLLRFAGNLSDPKPVGYWQNLNGIDGLLIKAISRNINFTIELLPLTTSRTFLSNGTGFGCFAQLLNGEADIAIGGFSASDPKRCLLSLSKPYHRSPVVFVVRSGQEFISISRLARPFNSGVWNMVTILLFSVIVVVRTLQAVKPTLHRLVVGERNDAPILNAFAVFLGYPLAWVPRKGFACYVLILWVLTTMILRNAYQGSMYDTIRMDKFVKIPSGYEELLKWNYQVLLPQDIEDSAIFPVNRTIPLDGGYLFGLKLLTDIKGKYATVALRDNFENYVRNNWSARELKIVKEQIYLHRTAMYFPKHSIYVEVINRHIQMLNYHGITRRIARNDAEQHHMGDKKKGVLPKPISNDQLNGLYEICVDMLVLAVVVWGLEVLSVHCKKLRSVIEWIN